MPVLFGYTNLFSCSYCFCPQTVLSFHPQFKATCKGQLIEQLNKTIYYFQFYIWNLPSVDTVDGHDLSTKHITNYCPRRPM